MAGIEQPIAGIKSDAGGSINELTSTGNGRQQQRLGLRVGSQGFQGILNPLLHREAKVRHWPVEPLQLTTQLGRGHLRDNRAGLNNRINGVEEGSGTLVTPEVKPWKCLGGGSWLSIAMHQQGIGRKGSSQQGRKVIRYQAAAGLAPWCLG